MQRPHGVLEYSKVVRDITATHSTIVIEGLSIIIRYYTLEAVTKV